MNKIHEECGVFGVYAKEKTSVASTAYYGLFDNSNGDFTIKLLNSKGAYYEKTFGSKMFRQETT